MKKLPVVLCCLLLVGSLAFLSGCEIKFNNDGRVTAVATLPNGGIANTTAPPYEVTALVDVTDENGSVVDTQAVTLSPQEMIAGEDFFATAETANAGANEQRMTGKAEQNDREVLNSSEFALEGRMTGADGTTYQIRMARRGNYYSALYQMNGTPVGLIIGAVNLYIVNPEEKTYFLIPKAAFADYAGEEALDSLADIDTLEKERVVVSEKTETVDGKEMNVIRYQSGSADYYLGNSIIKTVNQDGSVLYYDSVKPEASLGLFAPPADYTMKALNAENVEAFAAKAGVTEATHE